MSYVLAAYAVAIALVGGYVVSVVRRRRAAARELAEWRQARRPDRPDDPGPSDEGRT